jgi:hypothetical protein
VCAGSAIAAAACSCAGGALLESQNLDIILPRPFFSGAALDDVHIGEGSHRDNLLHGQGVVVVTRKGDKIKGERLC